MTFRALSCIFCTVHSTWEYILPIEKSDTKRCRVGVGLAVKIFILCILYCISVYGVPTCRVFDEYTTKCFTSGTLYSNVIGRVRITLGTQKNPVCHEK